MTSVSLVDPKKTSVVLSTEADPNKQFSDSAKKVVEAVESVKAPQPRNKRKDPPVEDQIGRRIPNLSDRKEVVSLYRQASSSPPIQIEQALPTIPEVPESSKIAAPGMDVFANLIPNLTSGEPPIDLREISEGFEKLSELERQGVPVLRARV